MPTLGLYISFRDAARGRRSLQHTMHLVADAQQQHQTSGRRPHKAPKVSVRCKSHSRTSQVHKNAVLIEKWLWHTGMFSASGQVQVKTSNGSRNAPSSHALQRLCAAYPHLQSMPLPAFGTVALHEGRRSLQEAGSGGTEDRWQTERASISVLLLLGSMQRVASCCSPPLPSSTA